MTGHNRPNLPKSSAAAVRRFYEFGFPSSALPFLMRLTRAVALEEVDETLGTSILDLLESFLVRRAICGIEPTGLHAIFRRLWADVSDDLSADTVEEKIRNRTTVTWPSDELVERSVKERGLYGSAIASYVIRQYDISLGGDLPENISWIEHILPQKPEIGWLEDFSKEEIKSMQNLWANLIPLSSKMNIELKNSIYAKKRPAYLSDAMFKSARVLGEKHDDWKPADIQKRSQQLANWSIKRWSI